MPPRRTDADLQKQRDRILGLLQDAQHSMNVAELQVAYGIKFAEKIPERTVRRWLTAMAREGLLLPEGKTKSRRYRVPPRDEPTMAPEAQQIRPVAAPPTTEPAAEDYPPISPEGERVRTLVRLPVSQRTPCTYTGKLLGDYTPGQTWYIEPAMRQKLHALGRDPIKDQPLGTYARHILERLLVDLSYESSRLEGNRYSLLDTQELLNFGTAAAGTTPQERQMILNHKSAIAFISEDAANLDVNRLAIIQVHGLLSENLMGDSSLEGTLRKREVVISNSVYRPNANQYQIKAWFEELAAKAEAITDPFEQSFFLLVHLPYLQPFTDVNKRTSRVMANLPLVKAELCPLSFLDVSRGAYAEGLLGVYELERMHLLRDVFVWAYERSCQQYRTVIESIGEPDPIRQKYRNAMREMVRQAIKGGTRPDTAGLQQWARDNAQAREDAVPLFESIREEFENLRPELAARYSLRAEVVDEWLHNHGSR